MPGHGAGNRQGTRGGKLPLNGGGRGAEGLEQEAVARCGHSCPLGDVEAIQGNGIGHAKIERSDDAIRAPDDGSHRGRGEVDLVVGGGKLAGVADGKGQGCCTGVQCCRWGGDEDVGAAKRGGAEDVAANVAIQVQPQRMLGVHLGADGHGQPSQQVAPLHQVGVLEAQQTRHLAAAQGVFVHHDLDPVAIHGELVGGQATKVLDQRNGRRVGPQYDGLAAANEDAHRAVIGGNGSGLNVLVEFAHQLVAAVQEIVGRLAAARGPCDLAVYTGNVLCQAVDVLHLLAQFL